jgi:hypothetical protein
LRFLLETFSPSHPYLLQEKVMKAYLAQFPAAAWIALAVPTLILAHQVLIVTVPQLIHALLPASVRALLQIL